MGFMQGMQQSQQQMLQGMQQSQQQLMLQPRPVTTLAALEDRSHRQAGLMGFEPPLTRQRTTPLFEELPDSPAAKSPALAAAPDGTMAVFGAAAGPADATAAPAPAHAAAVEPAPDTLAVTQAVVAVPATVRAGGDIIDLLGLIEERKTEAKARAAEAKAAKVAEAKAAKATEAATAAVGEVGAKAKAAAPGRCEGRGEGRCEGRGEGRGEARCEGRGEGSGEARGEGRGGARGWGGSGGRVRCDWAFGCGQGGTLEGEGHAEERQGQEVEGQ